MSRIFKVYQIQLDDDLVDLINKEGWNCHVQALAYIEASHKGDPKLGIMHNCYTHVADVVADDLNHVFEVGNIGPEDRIIRIADRMTSISVGNIIEDDAGNKVVVAKFGFDKIVDGKIAETA